MNIFKRYNLKSILLTAMWIAIGSGSLALLIAAVHTKNTKHCNGLEINIHGVSNNFFIDQKDVEEIIRTYAGDSVKGLAIETFNLGAMEKELKKNVWIKDADLFFDNNNVLQAAVEEREPVARVFTLQESSFYIDDTNMMLPISDKLSAKLPVFTSFLTENKVLSKADSSLLNDVRNLSMLIQKDPFLMAMIDQVDITSQRTFEMIPKIGDQVIIFGDASNAEQKFRKLELFYKKVMMKYGWNRYSIINLQYKGQVIGKLKGKDDVSADSARTIQIMQEMATEAARQASDSLQTFMQDNDRNTTSISLIEQSMERDDEEPMTQLQKMATASAAPEKLIDKPAAKHALPVIKKPVEKISKPPSKPVVKPVAKPGTIKTPALKTVEKPKVVMPKKNDY